MLFFQTKNQTLGKFFEGLAMEDAGNFMAPWYTLRPFGIFLVIWYIFGHLVYFWSFGILLVIWYIFGHLVCMFFPFWYVVPRKIWQPCFKPQA
jgi:hypothetical protein